MYKAVVPLIHPVVNRKNSILLQLLYIFSMHFAKEIDYMLPIGPWLTTYLDSQYTHVAVLFTTAIALSLLSMQNLGPSTNLNLRIIAMYILQDCHNAHYCKQSVNFNGVVSSLNDVLLEYSY